MIRLGRGFWIQGLTSLALCAWSSSALAVVTEVGVAKLEKTTSEAKVGQAAPDFEIELSAGKTTSLGELAKEHGFVVLEWYNQDCPYVRKHYDTENMQTLQKNFRDKKVAWLTVISSAEGKQGYLNLKDAKARIESGEKNFAATALVLDPAGTVGRSYGAKTTPHMYIIDKEGTLRYAGAIDGVPTAKKEDVKTDKTLFASALSTLLAGGKLSATEALTKPYGCSVKYN